MKQKIILTRGIPASGKTFWAEEYVKENPNFENINRDNLRIELFNTYKVTKKQEQEVTDLQFFKAKTALYLNHSIVISDTNLNPKTQNKWIEFAKQNNLEFEYKDFLNTPFEICLDRDKKREKSVGREVILDFHNKYIVPTLPKHCKTKLNCQPAYIVDIDGTVALMDGKRTPYEYDKVFGDIPNKNVLDVVTSLSKTAKIIFVSGREAVCKQVTIDWLDKHCSFDYRLFMRQENDRRPDYIVKNEIFAGHINDRYNVLGVFDDRDQVVKMWRDWGLTVFQVAYGDF